MYGHVSDEPHAVADMPRAEQNDADLDITVASRSAASFEAAQESHPALRGVAFVPCDIDDTARLAEVLQARTKPAPLTLALSLANEDGRVAFCSACK